MTDEQIEWIAERAMDRLDARLMDGEIHQEDYDAEVKTLNEWVEAQYRQRKAA